LREEFHKMNIFKKKERNETVAGFQAERIVSEDISLNVAFASLVNRYSENLKDKFTSSDIISRFHIKDRELQKILSKWIAELVEASELDLIMTGKNENGDFMFMRGELFDRVLKNKLNQLDNLLNENQTYAFLQEISGSKDVNLSLLRSEIERKMNPLVRFDEGSRNMPVILNLCKYIIPETNVFINDEILQKYDLTPQKIETESKKVKKIMFSATSKNKEGDAEDIIVTAFSMLLQEAGKLILTREDIEKTRAYRVFFSSMAFETLQKLAKIVYKYSPLTGNDFISFYPENWLDIKIISEQIEKEGELSPAMTIDELVKQRYAFLTEPEIATMKKIMAINNPQITEGQTGDVSPEDDFPEKGEIEPIPIETLQYEAEDTIPKKTELRPFPNPENPVKTESIISIFPEDNGTETGNKSVKKNDKLKKKKKFEPSEPLKFLDSMIVNENSKENIGIKRAEAKYDRSGNGTFNIKAGDLNPDLFNKSEKHFLIRILDSTMVESGYYSHEEDGEFGEFTDKLRSVEWFEIQREGSGIIIRRNPYYDPIIFTRLRREIEEGFLEETGEIATEETEDSKTDTMAEQEIIPAEKSTENSEEDFKSERIDITEEGQKTDSVQKQPVLNGEIFSINAGGDESTDTSTQSNTVDFTETEGDYDKADDSLLSGLLIDDSSINKDHLQKKEIISTNDSVDEDDRMDFYIKSESSKKASEETDSQEIFEIIKNNFNTESYGSNEVETEKSPPSDFSQGSTEGNVNEPERMNDINTETPAEDEDSDEENILEGKIISVLTEDEEKWLKIEMMSKMLGFELRDGLAYRPDIAIFDDSYKHLEPIARNSGALIMNLDQFMKRIGLTH